MNVKLLLILSLFVFQLSFSQTEKFIKGTVSSEGFLLQNVDVINKTSKQATKTNENGEFTIAAKVNDSLLFYAKVYHLQRLKVTPEQAISNNLKIVMVKKAEELDEVVITTMPINGSGGWYSAAAANEIAVQKSYDAANNRTVYDGTIDNGMNFVELGKKILRLFKKDKESTKEGLPGIEFATVAKKTCDQKFFIKTLKLKPEEIELFLQFCDIDPKSKKLKENANVLSMMDFLTIKNIEFQKLKQEVK